MKILLLFVLHIIIIAGVIGYIHYTIRESIQHIKKGDFYRIENVTFIRDENNVILGKIGHQCREYIALSKVPGIIIETLISVEDEYFFTHSGLSIHNTLFNILKALFTNYQVVGASTITQQTARNVFLTQEVSIIRKMKEAWLALILSKYVSKEKILEIYINHIFLGENIYGLNSAAKRLFNKNLDQLSINEIAFIIGMIKGPSYYLKQQQAGLTRKDYVLKRMYQTNLISKTTYNRYLKTPVEFHNNIIKSTEFYSYIIEDVRLILEKKNLDPAKGYNIILTLDNELQTVAVNSLRQRIKDKETSLRTNNPGIYRRPEAIINGAVMVIDPNNGKILAMVGGRGLSHSYVNGVKIVKSPGSIVKLLPLITALEMGYTPDFQIYDGPLYIEENGKIHYIAKEEMDAYRQKPGKVIKNTYDSYVGSVTLEEAIVQSVNTSIIILTSTLGVDKVQKTAVKMGLLCPSEPYYLASSLGAIYTTMENFVQSMAPLANGGYKLNGLYYIDEIRDFDDNVVFKEEKENMQGEKIFEDSVLQQLNIICGKVKQYGMRNKLNMIYMPLMCKSGTGQNHREAAFLAWNDKYMIYVIIYSMNNDSVDNLWGSNVPLFIARDILIYLQKKNEIPALVEPVSESET